MIQGPDRFEKFNESARLVLTRAQEEAVRLNHLFIGTEHLLLGLARDDTSQAARILNDMGVELPKIRSTVAFIISNGPKMSQPGAIGLTPRAKRVIDLTFEEARLLNHASIGPEHILLGLIAEGEGIAAGVLKSFGVELEPTRQRVKQIVDEDSQGDKGLSQN
jgi:ATP-dependent Clp protease ATP-binding subunit ClpC